MKILKESGNYLETKADENKKISYVFFIIGMLVFFLKLFSPIFKIGNSFSNRASNYRSGLEAEKLVTETLFVLDDNYYLINDIKLPESYGNIDHVILGPNGIFVIETKNYSGTIICNGDEWIRHYEGGFLESDRDYDTGSPSKQVKRNAVKIKQILDRNVWVEGIVVFTNPNVELQISGTTTPILQIDELCDYIKNKKSRIKFSTKELESIGKTILKADKNILC